MTLKEFITINQITILELSKITKEDYYKIDKIVNNKLRATSRDKNAILNALVKFKLNPIKIIFE